MHTRVTEACERQIDDLLQTLREGRLLSERHADSVWPVAHAIVAEMRHEQTAPEWACPLPTKTEEIKRLICSGHNEHRLLGFFARSWRWCGWDERHPHLDPFVSGLLAYEYTPIEIRCDPELQQLYPPRPLAGLCGSELAWHSP
jgi:hypothetical protein